MGPRVADFAADTTLECDQFGIGRGRRVQQTVLLQSIRPFESLAAMMAQMWPPLTVNITHMANVVHLSRRPIVTLITGERLVN